LRQHAETFCGHPRISGSEGDLALLRYAIVDTLRSRRRTFSSILGVLLSISFVAGTFIAIDSSTRATLEAVLAGLPGDFTVYAEGNLTSLRETLIAVSGVKDVAFLRNVPVFEIQSTAVPLRTYVNVMGVEPEHPIGLLKRATVEGSLDFPRGTIGLSRDLAMQLEAERGQNVSLRYVEYDYVNQTENVRLLNLTVSAIITIPPQTTGFSFPPGFFQNAVVHIRDVDWIEDQLQIPGGTDQLVGEVYVDRLRLVDPYDTVATDRNLGRLERQLSIAVAPFRGSVQNNISNALMFFLLSITFQRLQYLFLSLPVLLLGLYLGVVGMDLGHAERRRELAVFKARGAGPRQVVGLLLLEAAIGGVLAAVLGLVVGLGLSRLLLETVNPYAIGSAPEYAGIILSSDTVIAVAAMSVLLMATVSFRSARRTGALPIVETLRYYAPGETKIPYKPTADAVMLALAVASYGGILYTRYAEPGFLTFILGAIFFVLFPLAPVFLIVGTTRLLTRFTGRVYEWSSRAFKPFAKDLYHVISRNIARNPRRCANIAVIIALGLGFGMFVFSFYGSQQAYSVRNVWDGLGADVVATWSAPSNETMTLTNLTALPEIERVARVAQIGAEIRPCCASAIALDPTEYFSVAHPEWFYFEGTGPEQSASILATPGNVLVTRSYFDQAFLEIGDRLTLASWVYDEANQSQTETLVNATVSGVVKGLPGTGYGAQPLVFGSFETLEMLRPPAADPFRISNTRFLMALRASEDWPAVKNAILAMGATSVVVFQEQKVLELENPFQRAFIGFISMEIAFVLVILTAGLGLILVAATLERDVEFAAITARGSSGWQTASLLVGEAFSIMLIGLLIGAGVGLGSAFATLSLISSLGSTGVVPLLFELSPQGFLLLAVAPATMLLAAALVSWRIARMDIARVLKLRGG